MSSIDSRQVICHFHVNSLRYSLFITLGQDLSTMFSFRFLSFPLKIQSCDYLINKYTSILGKKKKKKLLD